MLGRGDLSKLAGLVIAVVTAIWIWWALRQGAYFGVVFLPGALILLLLLGGLLLYAPLPGRIRGWPAAALLALAGIALLSALSAIWSPSPATAIADAQREAAYAVSFALGLWTCLLLGRRMAASLAPLAIAGACVAVVTLVVAGTGHDAATLLEGQSTLRYPLGYRNANGAFFLITAFTLIVLASERSLDWRLRGAAVGMAVACVDLAVLAQSRGSVFATAAAVIVLVAVSAERLRSFGWFALVAAGAAAALPWALRVYSQASADATDSIPDLHTACAVIGLAAIGAAVVGAVIARSAPSAILSPPARRRADRVLVGLGAGLIAAGTIAVVSSAGGPEEFLQRGSEQLTAGSSEGVGDSRFGISLETERGDIWRVALRSGVDHPLIGEGGGGFRSSYLLTRDSAATPEDPHSVELLMFSELGVPGLALLLVFLCAVVAGALRSRRLGPTAALVATGALTAGGYWLVHASVEWFWPYPAVTAPVIFMLGAACAPAIFDPAAGPVRRRSAAPVCVLLVLVGLSLIPPFLSERYTNGALRGWRADLPRAYEDLDRAKDLNRLADRPLLAEAVIAERLRDYDRALRALDEAERREPDDWTSYYLEARVLARRNLADAAPALAESLRLNPFGDEPLALERRIRRLRRSRR